MIDKIKSMFSSPFMKSILFFTFYFILFTVLFNVSNNSYKEEDIDKEENYSYEQIKKHNYTYEYNIKVDDEVYKYVGKQNKEKEEFKFNGNKYYSESGVYFVDNNNKWVKTKNPYKYKELIDIENISKLVKKSKFSYKTNYQSGRSVYYYNIATDNINKIIYNKNTEYDDMFNEIIFSVDSNNNIESIVLRLDNYCQSNKLCDDSMKLELNYSKFGKTKEITSPLV